MRGGEVSRSSPSVGDASTPLIEGVGLRPTLVGSPRKEREASDLRLISGPMPM
jgi:hypothetical protein